MEVVIKPSKIGGRVLVPASKSISQRALAASLLRNGTTIIKGVGKSNDELAALDIIRACGADVRIDAKTITIQSRGLETLYSFRKQEFNAGESGLASRMFIPILALSHQQFTMRGEGTLLTRPFHFFEKHLPRLNVRVESNNGFLPLTLQGPLCPQSISLPGNEGSQYLSGLMMAFAAASTEEVLLKIESPSSIPYLELTKNVLLDFGFNVRQEDVGIYLILPKDQMDVHSIDYTIEGDWSNAAFWIVSGAIFGKIQISGLDFQSAQGDRAILELVKSIGAKVSISDDILCVQPGQLTSFEYDATHTPDLFPPLAVLASAAQGRSLIKGVHRLVHKESNRADALVSEFSKMGITIFKQDDYLVIEGNKPSTESMLNGWNDHRMVMALTLLALRANDSTTIQGIEAVNKSYPDFFEHLRNLGAKFIIR